MASLVNDQNCIDHSDNRNVAWERADAPGDLIIDLSDIMLPEASVGSQNDATTSPRSSENATPATEMDITEMSVSDSAEAPASNGDGGTNPTTETAASDPGISRSLASCISTL